MAVPVLPYTVECYNSLPELQMAKCQFESTRAPEILFTEIGKAVLKHHVEKMLGVTLLHNHFLLQSYEMLVNFDSVALPVDTRSGTKQLGLVYPSAWRFTEKGIAPYEFTHTVQETLLDNQLIQSFSVEFAAILAKWKLTNVFGVCSLKEQPIDSPTTMEFTSGRANITLPFDITPDDGNTTDAMWRFSSNPICSSPRTGLVHQSR